MLECRVVVDSAADPAIRLSGWALVLGASSGFGEAASLAFAEAGLSIIGVHLDRKATLPNAERIAGQVRRSAIRQLLAATLLHCTDHHAAPAELVLGAAAEASGLRLSVLLRSTSGDKGIPAEPHYRKITSEDLTALAVAEGVQLERPGDAVVLRFPLVG